MNIFITGVLEDGSPRSPSLPVNTRATLRFQRGAIVNLYLDVFTSSGVPVDLSDATKFTPTLTAKQSSQQVIVTPYTGFTLPGEQTGPKNRVLFSIVEATTRNLQPGRFVWDIWLVQTVGGSVTARDALIPLSPLLLEPSVLTPP